MGDGWLACQAVLPACVLAATSCVARHAVPCSNAISSYVIAAQAAYCSRDCQARHWREGGHKDECRRLVAERQAAASGSSAS